MKMAESPLKGWEMLVTCNFSSSHSVFKRLVSQTCKNKGLFGKGLNGLDMIFSLSSNCCSFTKCVFVLYFIIILSGTVAEEKCTQEYRSHYVKLCKYLKQGNYSFIVFVV